MSPSKAFFIRKCRDFPGSPVVKTSPSNAGVADSIPGQGAKIPHASGPKKQNIKKPPKNRRIKQQRRNEKTTGNQLTNDNKYLVSIIYVNVNGLSTPRHRTVE